MGAYRLRICTHFNVSPALFIGWYCDGPYSSDCATDAEPTRILEDAPGIDASVLELYGTGIRNAQKVSVTRDPKQHQEFARSNPGALHCVAAIADLADLSVRTDPVPRRTALNLGLVRFGPPSPIPIY